MSKTGQHAFRIAALCWAMSVLVLGLFLLLPDTARGETRPMGLAMGPDGALYISDSQKGRIWRVVYAGEGE